MAFAAHIGRSAPGRKLGAVQEKWTSPIQTEVLKADRTSFFGYLQQRFNVKKILA